ncbi:MAG: hypothetical protein AAGD35_18045 [Actinomycetota bacterium]
MALQQRRETPGRARFLLALSLSTVTALGVAAPLAIQALRADEVKFAGTPDPQVTPTAPAEEDEIDRSLEGDSGSSKGGIGSREPAKAVAQTSKSETPAPRTPQTSPDDSVLTNPDEETPDDETEITVEGETTTTESGSSSSEPDASTTAPIDTTVPEETTTTTETPESPTSSSATTTTTVP